MVRIQITEHGHVSIIASNGGEMHRICKFSTGWKVMPVLSQRAASKKHWPDAVTAARKYFDAKTADAVEAALNHGE